jgi:hypothetical protein
MTYYYQEFTRKLPVFDPKPGPGNYQEVTHSFDKKKSFFLGKSERWRLETNRVTFFYKEYG